LVLWGAAVLFDQPAVIKRVYSAKPLNNKRLTPFNLFNLLNLLNLFNLLNLSNLLNLLNLTKPVLTK